MADLDRELATRLSRLATAVPVAPGRLDPVHRGAVEARQRVRMAWLTPLVILVAGVLLTSAIGIGPFAPAGTPGMTPGRSPQATPNGTDSGPVTVTTRSGDFELMLASRTGRYTPDEPIELAATLIYHGVAPIEIAHAQGANIPALGNGVGPDADGRPGPVGFGIVEPVVGDLALATFWRESCERLTLLPGESLLVPFAKSAGFSSDDPRADAYRAFLLDPDLKLDAGTWHPYAAAEFSIGD